MARELSASEVVKLVALMAGDGGTLIRAALAVEAADVVEEAGDLVMDREAGLESKHQAFDELNARSEHIAWTRNWLDSIGKSATAAE